MWELDQKEGWVLKNWCIWTWRRLLRVPWTARSNQSVLKEINPEYSLEGPMLKLKLQYFGYLMQRANSLEKTLMLGKIEVRRKRGWQRMRWFDGITSSMDMNLSNFGKWWRTGKTGMLQSMGSQRVGHNWAAEQQEQIVDKNKSDHRCWDGAILHEGKKMEGSCWALFWRIDFEPVTRNA